MKSTLVIGSTFTDIIINIDRLPKTAEDVPIHHQQMTIGGCAYNAYNIMRHFAVPALLFSPTGSGFYGDFVREGLRANGTASLIPPCAEPHGCCYCLVEKCGERTFMVYYGAESLFFPEWFDALPMADIDSVYVCGLDLLHSTGGVILDFLERNPALTIYFAPGPRITEIAADKMARMLDLQPLIHLNELEVTSVTGQADIEAAAQQLSQRTGAPVVVTLGPDGAYCYDNGIASHIPPCPATVVDTIGAGDSHIGAMMACLKMGKPLAEAAAIANQVSAAIIGMKGADMPQALFDQLHLPL